MGDFDNDGAIDVLIGNNGASPLLLKNNAARGNNWFGTQLPINRYVNVVEGSGVLG